jgi:hypothetical protein
MRSVQGVQIMVRETEIYPDHDYMWLLLTLKVKSSKGLENRD